MSRPIEVSATYARLIAQSEHAAVEQLLLGSRLSAELLASLEFITWQQLAVIFRNFDTVQTSPAWTAQLGAQFNIAAHGPLGFAALSAPTLGDAMEVMGRFYPARNTANEVWTESRDGRFYFALRDVTGDAVFARWLAEIVLKIMESLLTAILGHPVGQDVYIHFAHNAPDGAEDLTAQYQGKVTFGALESSLSVPESWLRVSSPLHDEPIYRANMISCREIIASRESLTNIAVVVQDLLTDHFDQQAAGGAVQRAPPTLDEVAQRLHSTPRTLIRRLKLEGATYRSIVESLRSDYAARLLREERLNVAQIGEILGYSDPANFGRAFRRWHGVSPAGWRRLQVR